jgi:hypothetical protein
MTTIVRGATYDRPTRWQQIVLNELPKRLAAQVRVMRSAPGASIDPRGAYIDAAVLLVPGDPNGVEVLTDELVVEGVARRAHDNVQLAIFPDAADARPAQAITSADTNSKPSPVRLQGATLLVDGRPFLPRIIQWQGEPLQFLAERGFNVVQLERTPTPQQIADAARHALWFIGAPPRPDTLACDGLGEPANRVIAWQLEDESLEIDPKYAARWADLVRQRDPLAGRPVMIAPESNWSAASKSADILLARHTRNVSADAREFDQWLSGRMPTARYGAPLWASFATQFDATVGRQAAALTGVAQAPPSVDARRLESLVLIACTRAVRGFVFASHSPLDESDAVTRHRAATLELINRRLQLLEPWLSAGKITGRVTSSDAGWSGVVLHVDRARLLIPIADGTPSHTAARSTTMSPAQESVFVVPGVPDSCQVFALSPAALRTLPTQRIAGGTRVAVRPADDLFVLMSEDPQVLQSLRQRIAREGLQFVRLERDRALLQAMNLADQARRLQQMGRNGDAADQTSANARSQLGEVDKLLASARVEQANRLLNSLNQTFDQGIGDERAEALAANLHSNPLALSDWQLADFAALQSSLASLRGSDNLLYGGDFEDLDQMSQFGWRHFRSPQASTDTRADLSPFEPKHGRFCLELRASCPASGAASTALGTAPLWIQSPPIPVTAGQLLEITGWVRIDEPLLDSDQGLQIIDSLGGPQLALAIRHTDGWQPFQMIRAAPESGELRLTIALSGIGTARLDAMMVRALQSPAPRRLPPADPFDALAPETAAPASNGPLFIAPQTP